MASKTYGTILQLWKLLISMAHNPFVFMYGQIGHLAN